MGLDMYMEGRVRTYKAWNGDPDEMRKALVAAAVKAGLGDESTNIDFIELSREVAYWRKANQIHKWFVDNVQDGKDNCGHYYVERDKLRELRDVCQQVIDASELVDGTVNNGWSYSNGVKEAITEQGQIIKDPSVAKQLLPNQEGFFFGSTDYDSYYLDDLRDTIEQIDKCLAMPEHIDFYYHSSW